VLLPDKRVLISKIYDRIVADGLKYHEIFMPLASTIERQLSLPVNDNYNCRLNHTNLAWFSLQLQY
jgi:hypothetical protein